MSKMSKTSKTRSVVIVGAIILVVGLARFLTSEVPRAQAQLQLRRSVEVKFEGYRRSIKDAHQVDIKNFKYRIPGGHADGKSIISYDLKQLIIGINFERDHTKDDLLALELAMDHLERVPDYYTRLERMEWQRRAEKVLEM